MGFETLVLDTLNDPDPVNDNFIACGKVQQVYVGTGYDVVNTSSPADVSADHEFDTISAANLGNADYLLIEATITTDLHLDEDSSSGAYTYLTIQTKEIGGSYADSMAESLIHVFRTSTGISETLDLQHSVMHTISWFHTLTAGEKSNGVQVKIIGRINASITTWSSYLRNVQTTISTKA